MEGISRRGLLRAGVPLAAGMLATRGWAAPSDPWAEADAIVARIRRTHFPAREQSIAAHGAKGDGVTLCTAAIASAISVVAQAGGGRVTVPRGRFLTGAVHLKSNVELHLEEGAILAFSTDPADYPVVLTRFEGVEMMGLSPLLYAFRQTNIAITGSGILDGQASAQHWWSWKGKWNGTTGNGWTEGMPDQKPARARLFAMAEQGVPVEKRVFGPGDYLRPAFVEPYDCDTVLIEGVKLRGAPFWQLHPTLCRNLIIRDVDVAAHGPNTDGCDPESCSDALIENVTFDTGDDCIAIKAGRNADGRRVAQPTQDVVIRGCTMREGHGGIAIGSEDSGHVRRIFVSDCRLDSPNLDTAIRFKNNAMRGAVLEDLHYRRIHVGAVKKAVVTCDFNYEEGANGPYRPVLRNVTIEGLDARAAGQVIDCQGLPNAPIGDLHFSHCRFDGVTRPSVIAHTRSITLDDVRVNGRKVDRL